MATSTSTLPHILLIGSTGRTGRLVASEALSRGHTITAIARKPNSLDEYLTSLPSTQRSQINVVKGDPTSEADMTNALTTAFTHASSKPVVIVSTLGQTRASGNPWAATTSPALFMTHAAEVLIKSISSLSTSQRSQISKLVAMSMFGATGSFDNLHCAIKPVMKYSNMKQTVDDHDAMDAVVRGQDVVNWVMVRPTMLKEGERQEIRVFGEDGHATGWWDNLVPSGITMASVAGFLVDVVVDDKWDRRTPVIVN